MKLRDLLKVVAIEDFSVFVQPGQPGVLDELLLVYDTTSKEDRYKTLKNYLDYNVLALDQDENKQLCVVLQGSRIV